MLSSGIDFSLNTDGTVFLDTSLSEQYEMICDTKKMFDKISSSANKASFLK
jgi:adenosine deaminase